MYGELNFFTEFWHLKIVFHSAAQWCKEVIEHKTRKNVQTKTFIFKKCNFETQQQNFFNIFKHTQTKGKAKNGTRHSHEKKKINKYKMLHHINKCALSQITIEIGFLQRNSSGSITMLTKIQTDTLEWMTFTLRIAPPVPMNLMVSY